MALAALSGDEQCIIFSQLCNMLDPGVAVTFSSRSSRGGRVKGREESASDSRKKKTARN